MLATGGKDRPSRVEDLLDAKLLARLERLDLRSNRIFAGKLQGERRSKKRGQSVEFDDYRLYVPGDDLRFIDWNVYARFDRLFVKLFLEEEDLALHIALDASASMDTGSPSKLLFGARLAAALASVGLVKNNRVSLSVFGLPASLAGAGESRAIARLGELRGRRHVSRVARFLLDAAWPEGRRASSAGGGAPGAGSAFNDALTTIARLRAGKGVMVIVSDFLIEGGYDAGLRSLAAAGGYDTYCLQVLSPGEVEPERELGTGITADLRLTDIETGRGAEVTLTGALIRKYKQRLEAYCAELRAFCLAREMTHLLSRSDADLDRLVVDTLRRAGMVG